MNRFGRLKKFHHVTLSIIYNNPCVVPLQENGDSPEKQSVQKRRHYRTRAESDSSSDEDVSPPKSTSNTVSI